MLTFAQKHAHNRYSQNGEDGILNECIVRIQPHFDHAVEFGAADGEFCSNTLNLYHHKMWDVVMYDLVANPPLVEAKEITPENVNEIPDCSVLSIDIDGNDYLVWMAYQGKPDIVIIEINSSLPPMREHFTKDRGASYITMLKLGIAKGYFLLCHTGNLIFILNKHRHLFPEIEGDGINNYELYFNKNWLI